jgi:predicted DNA-binding transcriptional regulator AlpA
VSTFNADEVLTVRELAKRLKVKPAWIYEKRRAREFDSDPLPAIDLGRYLRFRWADIAAWLERHTTRGPGIREANRRANKVDETSGVSK